MSIDSTVMDRHLLLQLGDRLRGLRKARGMTAMQMAELAGITRTTLRAVESGDPSSAIGTYLRVMSILGISGELAMLAGDTFLPAPSGSAAARSKRGAPVVKVEIASSPARHRLQDLQSMALHAEAVRLIKKNPSLAGLAKSTLDRWMLEQPMSRSMSLWRNWQKIISTGSWSKALSHTALGQQLRQASPLGAVLPKELREQILGQVADLKGGITLGGASDRPPGEDESTESNQEQDSQPEAPRDSRASSKRTSV
jgi:transcriptional regulator with XRE-family HTH domain